MNEIIIHDKHFKPYISPEEIALALKRMAAEISFDFKGKNPLFIAVLNGSFVFAADLLRDLDFSCELSFVKLVSYLDTKSTGEVKELIGLKEDIKDRHVVIVEDIVETGQTLALLKRKLSACQPASVKIATLLFKPYHFKESFDIDYLGFEIPEAFIVGYGLDFNGHGRNLKGIYQIV
ncbi:MAG: hypoxanthine phosphoribosyltransferase [Bacteroidota bacterium]